MSRIIKPVSVNNDTENVVKIPSGPMPKPIAPALPDGVTESEAQQILEQTAQPEVIEVDYEEILRKAQENAEILSQKIIIHAKKERGSIIAEAQEQAIKIKEQARKEGYASGIEEKSVQIDIALDTLAKDIQSISDIQQRFIADYVVKLKYLALDISKKVIGKALDETPEAMLPLIRDAVDTVKDCEWVTLELSKEIAEVAAFLDKEYQKIQPGKARIEVKTADTGKTSCILKTPEGIVDASVNIQLDNLRQYFEHMDLQ